MFTFSQFLTEALDVEKLKHLEHVEDHIFDSGHEGVSHAAGTLDDVIKFLNGERSNTRVTTKFDGSPSLVFGINPENKKFFVASKSAFNKNPKINYTDEDIEKNHGHAPGLVAKLKQALQYLPNIMPPNGGVYQGDVMYSGNDIVDNKDSYSFTPNTITYSAAKNSSQGRRIANSKFGIVVHTQYKGDKLDNMKANFDIDQGKFRQDPLVNAISPEVKSGKIDPIDRKRFERNLRDATDTYRGLDDDFFNITQGHEITLKTYINACIRASSKPSASGYKQFIESRTAKEIQSVKTDSSRNRKKAEADLFVKHITAHENQFYELFKLHSKIQAAKDAIVGALANTQEFQTTIGGRPTKPEGFVAIKGGRPSKLVDRAEFSKANFENGQFRARPAEVEEPTKPVVFAFGRMNPPTIGHGALVDKVTSLSKEHNAPHQITLSHSRDPDKNPLTGEQKLQHAKNFWPGANFNVADNENPNFLKQAQKLHKAGHDHLIMVAGSDRVEEFKQNLDRYNGEGEGKMFNFKKIEVVSAGDRDPDAEGVQGMSASKMRNHAIHHRFADFKKGIPSHVPDDHARALYHDVRRGMNIVIDSNTSNISLGKYALRSDIIGARARAEQQRRAQKKAMVAPKARIKKIAESFLAKLQSL